MKDEYHANEKCEITPPSSVSLTSPVPFCLFASSQSDILSACVLPHILCKPHSFPPFFIFLPSFTLSSVPSLSNYVISVSTCGLIGLSAFSSSRKQSGEERRTVLDKSLLGGISFTLSLFQSPFFSPPAFGCPPANFNTHHGMLGIVQQMPLRRTFLSGTTPLFTLFILKYLSPALIPVQHATQTIVLCENKRKHTLLTW